ncbi:MAG: hypothetical protein FWG85_02080 [Bacteroidetes bacterium]|nr:hypothetical protein [Bacteroidota bacterium]
MTKPIILILMILSLGLPQYIYSQSTFTFADSTNIDQFKIEVRELLNQAREFELSQGREIIFSDQTDFHWDVQLGRTSLDTTIKYYLNSDSVSITKLNAISRYGVISNGDTISYCNNDQYTDAYIGGSAYIFQGAELHTTNTSPSYVYIVDALTGDTLVYEELQYVNVSNTPTAVFSDPTGEDLGMMVLLSAIEGTYGGTATNIPGAIYESSYKNIYDVSLIDNKIVIIYFIDKETGKVFHSRTRIPN